MATSEIKLSKGEVPAIIPSLRANFAWTLAGNVLYAGCQWGMLSALAKLGSPSIVGQFTLGLAISAPVFMFTNLQLRAVQATDVNAESGFGDYFTLRLLATILGMAVILGLLPFVGNSNSVRVIILLVSISKCLECMSDVTAGLLQREEQLKRVAISLMIRGAFSAIVFSSAFAFTHDLKFATIGMCVVWAAVLLLYDLPNVRKFGHFHDSCLRFDRSELFRLAMLGLPLGWVGTLGSLNTNIPRYFLQHYLGLADQGIYASLAYLVVGINLLVSALSQSATTRLAREFSSRNGNRFKSLLAKLSTTGILIVAVGVPVSLIFGKPLLTLLYNRDYAEHTGLLAVCVAASGINTIASFLFCGVTAARSFRVQVPAYLAATVVGVGSSAWLIARLGLIGGALGMFLSSIVLMIGGFIALWQVVQAQNQLEVC
jgi:O-antigen/teichoic acid export membrane protein